MSNVVHKLYDILAFRKLTPKVNELFHHDISFTRILSLNCTRGYNGNRIYKMLIIFFPPVAFVPH